MDVSKISKHMSTSPKCIDMLDNVHSKRVLSCDRVYKDITKLKGFEASRTKWGIDISFGYSCLGIYKDLQEKTNKYRSTQGYVRIFEDDLRYNGGNSSINNLRRQTGSYNLFNQINADIILDKLTDDKKKSYLEEIKVIKPKIASGQFYQMIQCIESLLRRVEK